jgi:prepilin-type N-terminal cleavage/methylation domain-containing protein
VVFNGILELMPKLVHRSWFMVHRIKKTVNCQLLTVNYKVKHGFSLIELLIVISLFGLASSLITIAYLGFERNQRIKNAAITLKSDIRFVQNSAQSGDKSVITGSTCDESYTLIGWYLFVNKNSTTYDIMRVCQDSGGNEASILLKRVTLPQSIIISEITYGSTHPLSANVLFRPLSYSVSFHNTVTTPPFTDSSGSLKDFLYGPGSELIVDLQVGGAGNTYQVIIKPTGEVNEFKP